MQQIKYEIAPWCAITYHHYATVLFGLRTLTHESFLPRMDFGAVVGAVLLYPLYGLQYANAMVIQINDIFLNSAPGDFGVMGDIDEWKVFYMHRVFHLACIVLLYATLMFHPQVLTCLY